VSGPGDVGEGMAGDTGPLDGALARTFGQLDILGQRRRGGEKNRARKQEGFPQHNDLVSKATVKAAWV